MAIPAGYKEVIDGLIEASEQGRVLWQAFGGSVYVRLPDFTLELWAGHDSDEDYDFVSCGLKEDGQRGFADVWSCQSGEEELAKMQKLYDLAYRKSRKIDERLGVLKQLLKKREQPIGLSKPAREPEEEGIPF